MSRKPVSARAAIHAGVALLALIAAPGWAQSTQAADPMQADPAVSDEQTGDIVVIARKREERLVDVPISITALSGEDVAKLQATDLSGIQGAVPNVNLVQGRASSSSSNFFIRGIGQPDALQTFDPAVGTYIDGVYLSRVQGALVNLFDVERIEVLRGPQGTLYGKNTIGGAVNIVSRKPSVTDLTAAGSVTYGRYDQILVNGYVSTPLIADTLALSVAGVYDKRDGLVLDPLTGRSYNDRDTAAGRAILRATPSSGVELILSGDYTRQRNSATLGYATAPLINVDLGTGAVGITKPAAPYGPYAYKASTDLQPGQGQRLDHWGVSLTANVDLNDAFSLTSITAYRDLRPDFFIDFDATEAEVTSAFVGVRQTQFSQELQLKYDSGPLAAVVGLYYLNEDIASHQEAYADAYLKLFGNPVSFTRTIDDDQNTKSYAVFGQATYDLTDQLAVTGGLRYSRDDKRYFRTTTAIIGGAAGAPFEFPNSLPAPFNDDSTASFDAWTPTATLSFKPSRDTLLYGTISRGYKSGGFNGRVNTLADVTQEIDGETVIVPFFEPETVWSYEVGAKGNFLDGRVRLSAAGFYSDYQDFQARVGGGTTGVTGGSFPVINAGKLEIYGFEFETQVKPSDPLTLAASVGYLHAEYKEFNDGRRAPSLSCNPTGNAITCKPAFAPPLTMRLAADYAIPLGIDTTLTFGGEGRFVDKQFLSVDNRAGLVEDGYAIANAYVQADLAGGRFYLRGAVKNAFDELYKTEAQEFSSVGNIQTVYFGDPRTWSVTAGFRF